MPHARLPVPEAPITDRLLATLIQLFEQDHDATVTQAEAALMFQATPGCLRELLAYRGMIGREYARIWIDGAAEAGPNVVRLPANEPGRADPRGAA